LLRAIKVFSLQKHSPREPRLLATILSLETTGGIRWNGSIASFLI
jgi:hypothetical protein